MGNEKYVDKAPVLIESMRDNGGARSVFEVTSKGGGAPTHYHDAFDETFEILEGEVTLWAAGKKVKAKSGFSTTAKKFVRHGYKVDKNTICKVRVTLVPGHEGFENTIRIMNGMQKDGIYGQTSKFSWGNLPLIGLIMDMTNARMVGFPKFMMNAMIALRGRKNVDKLRKELLDKYCGEEAEPASQAE